MNERTRPQSRWTLAARITALLIGAAVLLAALAGVAVSTARANSHDVDTVFDEIAPLRTDSQQLLVALLDQETGVRGYALDGTSASLAPYTAGLAQQKALIADMSAHSAGHKSVAAELTSVQRAVDAWHANVAGPAIADVQAGNAADARVLLNNAGTSRFDAIRTSVTALQQDILAQRDAAVANLRSTSHLIFWELFAAAWIVLLTGVILVWLLRRLVTKPVHELAENVRIIAGGDFNHAIDMAGPPEIVALGRDVEDMRRRIVDDLRVVERANESVARANAQLQQHAAELVRSNEDLEQFAYVASHDLQEPLRKVASFCQLLQRRYAGRIDDRADQYISFAVDGAHRMQRLINELLEFSRIGRAGREMIPVDLGALTSTIAETFRAPVATSGGEITLTNLPVVVAEQELMVALMTNLIGNAVKFQREGAPIRVAVSGREVGTDWQITVTDNGIGIDPEQADRVFVIFQRLHTRDIYPGTGIGLSIAKRIVEYHGGRIWVDSAAATEGTIIRFTLPTTPRVETETLSQKSPAQQSPAPQSRAPESPVPERDPADGRAPVEPSVRPADGNRTAGGRTNEDLAIASATARRGVARRSRADTNKPYRPSICCRVLA